MARKACLILALAFLPAAAPAETARLQQEIASLIRDLGAERYRLRERASRRLWEIGEPALAALERAAESTDPEVAVRAKNLLADIRAGIRPDWPKELIRLGRQMDGLPAAKRKAAIDRLVKELGVRALPLLLWRLAVADAKDAPHALSCVKKLAEADAGVYQRIVARIKQPKTAYEGQALALARVELGDAVEALKVLTQCKVGSSQRRKIISKGVDELLALLGKFRFERAAVVAGQFAEAAPDDARFLYLQAEAISALARDRRAAELRDRALAMHAADESPHYTAGEMLQHKLGRRRLAELEWKKILAMKPDRSVYDMNALMRLHSIYAECKLYAKSADHLERGLKMVERARAGGGGVGLMGGSVEDLRKRIAALRLKAQQQPAGEGAGVSDRRPDRHIGLHVGVAVKDGKRAALRKALGQAAATLTIEVQPRGLRLFDKRLLSVRYDAGKGEIGVYLNDSRCSKPVPFRVRGKAARIAIRSLDCYYIYDVPASGGPAERVARFEKDYTLTFRPGNKIAACRNVKVTINGKTYEWRKLLAGQPLDYLDKKLDVSIEGTRPSGKPMKIHFQVAPREPPIRPPKPKPEREDIISRR